MTASNCESIANELAVLLKRELALYKEVRDISQAQKDLIAQGNADALLHLINEKQIRIDKISLLENTAAPLKKKREHELDRWTNSARAKVDPLVRELQLVLAAIVGLEEESRNLVEAASNNSGQQVQKIQRGKAMLNAYGKAARGGGGAPHYSDKNG